MASQKDHTGDRETDGGVLSADAPNTPFPAKTLFYVCLASMVLIIVGSVLAYVL